jgi:L-fuculose-phosphate aldolase
VALELAEQRLQLVEYGRKLIRSGLTTGSGGNLSIYDRRQGLLAITPSGIEYDQVESADVVVLDATGAKVAGERKPSSELNFHLAIYTARPDVGAVVHTHSVYATTLACMHWEIPAVHYLVAFSGKKVPLAPYATFGSPELADNVVDSLSDFNAVLLANHGLVAVGESLAAAFNVAEEIELVARIYYQTKTLGQPVLVEDAEMARVMEKFAGYGQQEK